MTPVYVKLKLQMQNVGSEITYFTALSTVVCLLSSNGRAGIPNTDSLTIETVLTN
jgi:hypothetical protein